MNVEKIIDRSWITKTRGMREYNDGCSAFVAFAVSNCTTTNGKIRCPCKYVEITVDTRPILSLNT
jgi:hypothetical protein